MDVPRQVSETVRKLNPHLYGGGKIANPDLVKNVLTGAKIVSSHKTRIRQDQKPLMNKLETQFWNILCLKYGDQHVKPQALQFKLGNGISYKPDFVITAPNAGIIECFEVKGPVAFRGGFENLKVAAGLWPTIVWKLVWKDKVSGAWQEQLVLP